MRAEIYTRSLARYRGPRPVPAGGTMPSRGAGVYIARKVRNMVRGFIQGYGPEGLKRKVWNHEYAGGRWAGLESMAGDCLYRHVEEHARGGDILDLGCGPGATGNELDEASYRTYTGVDISDVAV